MHDYLNGRPGESRGALSASNQVRAEGATHRRRHCRFFHRAMGAAAGVRAGNCLPVAWGDAGRSDRISRGKKCRGDSPPRDSGYNERVNFVLLPAARLRHPGIAGRNFFCVLWAGGGILHQGREGVWNFYI